MAIDSDPGGTAGEAEGLGAVKRIPPEGTVHSGAGSDHNPPASPGQVPAHSDAPDSSVPASQAGDHQADQSVPAAEAAAKTAGDPASPSNYVPQPAGEYGEGSPYSAYGYDGSNHPEYSPYPGEETTGDTATASTTEFASPAGTGTPPETEADDDEEGGPIKPFLEHLEDLRWTLVRTVSAVVIGMLICLVGANYLIAFLMWPMHLSESFFQRNRTDVPVVMGTNVISRIMPDQFGGTNFWGTNHLGSLHVVPLTVGTNTILALEPHFGKSDVPPPSMLVIKNYGPVEGILVALKLALYGGLLISSPFVFYFIGSFVLPALHVREKKILYQAVAYGTGLFLLGVAFCYFVVMVLAIGATVEFSNWLGFGADEWRAEAYISFVVKFMLGMGLTFELPVVILVLVKIGVLDYAKLKGFRQWAIVGNLVVAAFVTPSGDPVTMLAMAIPLQLLYEISTVVAWYWEWKERRKARLEAQPPNH